MNPLQLAVLAILDHCHDYEWSVQGFGLLRLYIRKVGRLHIWDSALRYPSVSMIHNHSWNLRSTVVFGRLQNHKFMELPADDTRGEPYWKHRLLTGYQARPVTEAEPVRLHQYQGRLYLPGDVYAQAADEIHLTEAEDSTVTLMERREDENGQADVFWRATERWGTATPRTATAHEVQRTVARVLDKIESVVPELVGRK